jgi:hypothetical protein
MEIRWQDARRSGMLTICRIPGSRKRAWFVFLHTEYARRLALNSTLIPAPQAAASPEATWLPKFKLKN